MRTSGLCKHGPLEGGLLLLLLFFDSLPLRVLTSAVSELTTSENRLAG